MLKRLGLGLLALFVVGCTTPTAQAAPPPNISYTVGVCDPSFPLRCIKPATDGSITVTATTTAKSTAAIPTYVEGTTNPLSGDLHGSNRSVILDSSGVAVDWSAPVTVINGGTFAVQNTAATPAGTNLTGDVGLQSRTTGGDTPYGLQATASTNSTLVSTGAHTIKGMNLLNTTTTIYYLRMYDSAGAPTCSSATGFVRTWPIPPAGAAGGAGGIAAALSPSGVAVTAGLSFCVTGGPTSTDNTNAAVGVFINLDYK